MNRILLRAAMLGWAVAAIAIGPVRADEITPEHLAAALEAVSASNAGRTYDNVLPLISEKVQDQLIRMRPDLYQKITDVVQGVALKLAARRADLNNDVARVWANAFSEDELKAITAFYKSPAGAKFLETGPKVVADSMQSLKGWSDRVGEELLEKSREELKQQGIEF
jgi:hypothetical protein